MNTYPVKARSGIEDIMDRIIETAPSMISQIISHSAITHWFDAETIAWMESKEEEETKGILDDLARNYTFVRPHPSHGYTYHENVRAAILLKLKTEDLQDFRKLNRRANAYFEHKVESATAEKREEFMREQAYHLLVSDEEEGFRMFLSM